MLTKCFLIPVKIYHSRSLINIKHHEHLVKGAVKSKIEIVSNRKIQSTFLRRYDIHLNFYDLPNSISKYIPDKFYLNRDTKSRRASENNFST